VSKAQYFQNRMTIRDIDVRGKRVLIRVDLNVPLSKGGKVEDDFRIRSSLPTIRYVLENGGRPILISHLGRPKGKRVPELSLRPVREVLERLLKVKVHLASDCIGDDAAKMAEALGPGEVLLLENSRFHAEETSNDAAFAETLARLADVYVNDAFGTAHRAHASTEGVTHYIRPAVAGFLMEKELEFLGKLLADPERPFLAIIGGAKISGKIEVLKNLMDKVDALIIGGGIANTFLKADGYDIGGSLCEDESLPVAREIMDLARTKGVAFLLPDDFIVAAEVASGSNAGRLSRSQPVPRDRSIVDIGEKTRAKFIDEIRKARTIFWNGPMGVFEIDDFAGGTLELARAVAAVTKDGAVSVIGGGDTASAVARAGVRDAVTHISTGGGASLEFVEGKELPGVAALTMKGEGHE
jgi:3-phosphoglycerate kinase